MTLSEMNQLLAERGIQLTKSLGQNFMHDANQVRRIIAAAELTRADRVLEIGPGLGPLTEQLLASAGHILAVEKDQRFIPLLTERFAANLKDGALELTPGDALELVARDPRDWTDWKLVANLPYSVASPILVEFALARTCPQRIVVTLQLEVARRLFARRDDDDYGVLSLLTQLRYLPGEWFKIPPGSFFPSPEVDSACVCLRRRPQPLLEPELTRTFTRLVKRGFSQRRKMMLKLLKAEWPLEALNRAFAHLELSPQIRAEAVSLDQFVALTRFLAGGNPL